SILITACDDLYVFLANDLFQSIQRLQYELPFDLGLLDVGLNAQNVAYFQSLGIKVVKVGVDIDFPARAEWEAKRPGIKTLTARPFIPRYFPGYDAYMWLDSDIWVQTPEAINTMLAHTLNSDGISIVTEFDRCYSAFYESADIWQRFRGWYEANYAPEVTAAMTLRPMLNAGTFAMHATSPLWQAWGDLYRDVLQNTADLSEKTFMADQLGLNILLYLKGMPCTLMPTHYNWLTYYALPLFDKTSGLYVEPLPPYRPISQIHLTRPQKNCIEKICCTDGSVIERALTFGALSG
ncbi:MAG: hypothetical protein JO126_08110, partial [Alphaproteobacteria bacterium]|nr:hypothetical protein [Alphaproteobacteria bacterium]